MLICTTFIEFTAKDSASFLNLNYEKIRCTEKAEFFIFKITILTIIKIPGCLNDIMVCEIQLTLFFLFLTLYNINSEYLFWVF